MNDATVPEPAKGTDVVMRKLSVALVGWKNRPHATFQSGGAVSDDIYIAARRYPRRSRRRSRVFEL